MLGKILQAQGRPVGKGQQLLSAVLSSSTLRHMVGQGVIKTLILSSTCSGKACSLSINGKDTLLNWTGQKYFNARAALLCSDVHDLGISD